VYILLPSNYFESLTGLRVSPCLLLHGCNNVTTTCDDARRRVDLYYPGGSFQPGPTTRRNIPGIQDSTVPKACNCTQTLPIGFITVTWPIPRGIYCAPVACNCPTTFPTSWRNSPQLESPANRPTNPCTPRSSLEVRPRIAFGLRSDSSGSGHGCPLLPVPV
jgi:hypothetical protein